MNANIRVLLFAAAIWLLLGAGCWSGPDNNRLLTETAPADKLTIRMMHLWPEAGAAGQHHIVGKIIGEYEAAHPHISIKQEVLDNEPYKAKIKILSAVHGLPDVGLTWAAGYLQPFVEGRLFTPLDDLLQSELRDLFVPGTTEAYMVNGRTYALPLEFNIAPIFYNKKIFAQYGLRAPTSYDELLYIVEKLTAQGIEPIALGNRDRWTGSLWYMYLADRIAGTETLSGAIAGNSSFSEPGLVEAARHVQTLADMNAFTKGFNGLSNDEAKAKFANGEAAMYLMGTWELPNYTTNQNVSRSFRDSVGFFKFPAVSGGPLDSWVGGPGVGLFVAEDSPVQEEAKRFVEYFVKRWGEESVAGAGIIPATKVDTSNARLPQLYIDLLEEINKSVSMTLFADVQMTSGAAEIHLNRIQALFGQEITPEQFAEAHDEIEATGWEAEEAALR